MTYSPWAVPGDPRILGDLPPDDEATDDAVVSYDEEGNEVWIRWDGTKWVEDPPGQFRSGPFRAMRRGAAYSDWQESGGVWTRMWGDGRLEVYSAEQGGWQWEVMDLAGTGPSGQANTRLQAMADAEQAAQQYHLGMRKGAPFADYSDFEDCVSKNSDKDDPNAYCGYIKHKVEDSKESVKSASLPRLSARDHVAAQRELMKLAANPYSPETNPYGDAMNPPGVPDDMLDGPPMPEPVIPDTPMINQPRNDMDAMGIMSSLLPLVCLGTGRRFAAKLTSGLRCVCGGSDYDLDVFGSPKVAQEVDAEEWTITFENVPTYEGLSETLKVWTKTDGQLKINVIEGPIVLDLGLGRYVWTVTNIYGDEVAGGQASSEQESKEAAEVAIASMMDQESLPLVAVNRVARKRAEIEKEIHTFNQGLSLDQVRRMTQKVMAQYPVLVSAVEKEVE